MRLWRKNFVGLDIDASAVRMVQLRRDNDGYAVVKAGVTDIAPWGNDPQLRQIHTVRAIVAGLARCGIKSKLAVCGLRGPEVVVRGFEFPALPPEEIAGAVEIEVSQICPFLAEESTLDYQVTSSDDKRTMGFWVAATNSLIENTRQLVSEAGLHCAMVDVAGLALLNILDFGLQSGGRKSAPGFPDGAESPFDLTGDGLGNGSSGDGTSLLSTSLEGATQPPWNRPAVLNLGDDCTTIAIADPAGRPFVRDIGSGAFAESRRSLAAARSGLHGSFPAEDGWTARGDYRSATSDSLVDDVTTTLRYYAAQHGAVRVDRLLVCGAGAAEESIELLRTRLNIEVEPWNPLLDGGFRPPVGAEADTREEAGATKMDDEHSQPALDKPQRYDPSLAVAAGLAMRSV